MLRHNGPLFGGGRGHRSFPFKLHAFQKTEASTSAGQLVPQGLSRGREFPTRTRTKARLAVLARWERSGPVSGEQRQHRGAASPQPWQGGLSPLHVLGEDQVLWAHGGQGGTIPAGLNSLLCPHLLGSILQRGQYFI